MPLGTGNALYHSIHRYDGPRPSPYIQGLRDFLLHASDEKNVTRVHRALPIYRATFSPGARLLTDEGRTQTEITNNTLYGAVVISCGFHATLVADSDTPEYRKYGDARFGMVAKELMSPEDGSPPHIYKADVRATFNG